MEDEFKSMNRKGSDLSDIVLEKSSKKAVKTKKWLLTAASAIVLFLILSLLYKMFAQNSQSIENSDLTVDSDNVENVVKDVDAGTNVETETKSENLFKKEPIIEENSDTDARFEELVKKLKEQDSVTQEVKPTQTTTPPPKVESVKEVKPQELKTVTTQTPDIPVVTTPAQEPKIIQTPVIRQSTPVVTHKPKPKVTHTPAPKKHVAKKSPSQVFAQTQSSAVSGYFIQVGATAKSFPDKRFLSKIKNSGFDYIVHTVFVNGRKIKKVLVGPYHSKAAAQSVLGKVKANINPGAYIYRLK